ncbi:MAG: hypothetical protein JWP97_4041 [Labilithrix sp.]|nr:hypothetical protein [Labilithrix sp.]
MADERPDPDTTDPHEAGPASAPEPSRRPLSSSGESRERAPSSGGHGHSPAPPSVSRPSLPPSEPRPPSRGSFAQMDASAADRPARLQMIVALVLGVVLVAIPLYLWRRPRADTLAVPGPPDAGLAVEAGAAVTEESGDKPAVGEVRVLACQDPGPKKTAPGECDRLPDVEKALTKAIEDTAACVTKEAGGGTIVYVADVSFKRKAINVATPKDGRTLKNARAVGVCQAAVKSRLSAMPLDTVTHAHARYRIAVTATYPGTVK